MRQTFAVAFYCRNAKVTKNGTAAIEMSIIINGKRSFMSLPMKVKPSEFQTLYSQKRNNPVKEFCTLYYNKVNESVRLIIENGKPLTPETVKNVIVNGIQNTYKLSELFKEHLSLVEEKTRTDLSYGTYRKYELAFDEFLKVVTDKEAKTVTNSDVEKFITHLRLTHKPATVRGYLNKVKSAYLQAIRDDKLRQNPFTGIRIKNPRERKQIPSMEEYQKIVNKRFNVQRLETVREIFVLAASTGLSYSDLMLLEPQDIRKDDNGNTYIEKRRKKTGVTFTSVVLKEGVEILDKYNNDITPLKKSGQRLNGYLLEIQDTCGIKCRITMHVGRHIYCSRLIQAGVSPAIVQRALGHSKITTTIGFYTSLTTESVIENIKGVI